MATNVQIGQTRARPYRILTTRHGDAVSARITIEDANIDLFFDIATWEEIHSAVMWEAQRKPFTGDDSHRSSEHLVQLEVASR